MKSKGVKTKYGNKALFSFLYKPGATNFHSCVNKIGLVIKKEAKKATFKYVRNASCNAVNINFLSKLFSIITVVYGLTKKA